jgi:hypothetical protein
MEVWKCYFNKFLISIEIKAFEHNKHIFANVGIVVFCIKCVNYSIFSCLKNLPHNINKKA